MKRLIIIFLLAITVPVYSFTKINIPIKDSSVITHAHYRAFLEMNKVETGHNQGSHIKKYMNFVGLSYKKQYPYCVAGICWSFGNQIPFKRTASTQRLYENCKKIGKKGKKHVEKYNIIIYKTKNKYSGHGAMIDSVGTKGRVWTFEFNTSPNSKKRVAKGKNREGDGNFRKQRNINHMLGKMYIRGIIGYTVKTK